MSESAEILIVDDSPSNIDVLSELLHDYRRRVAIDGPTALRLAQSDPPDLVLLDVLMPKMDGFEVCRHLKADPAMAGIPVIFITGLGDEKNETLGFEVGGVDYITKPFNAKVVRARVQMQIELKAGRDRLRTENSRLEARVEARTAELHAALESLRKSAIDTVFRLGLAAEYKDDDTGQHVLRMANYAVAVARELGWKQDALDLLLHAAPMHDIGKIAMPDSILKKPGPLDASEWKVIKQHPLIGARILSGSSSDVIRLAEVVALTHHEKWNGSGYPYGISGDAIPLVGRIVAVCDVFDALTVRRPYKGPFPLPEALSIIRESAGSHFDPTVVEAFFSAQPEIMRVRAQYTIDERQPKVPEAVVGEGSVSEGA
jgi:putative two-component system response regulator